MITLLIGLVGAMACLMGVMLARDGEAIGLIFGGLLLALGVTAFVMCARILGVAV